jgi:ABC-type phosphate/phosphonate transport system substrate-binding protein
LNITSQGPRIAAQIRVATNGHAYYAVTPSVEVAWKELLLRIGRDAGIAFDFLSYPLPQPQEELWARSDIGCVFFMCGYPIAMRHFAVAPIAAPILSAPWAQGRAVYRSDLIVKADSHFQTLADTFGGRLGWTTNHSHSAFNALRYHLLQYRTHERPTLYSQVVGDLGSVRKLFQSVCDGAIDVGAVDAYWHLLLRHHQPELATRVRVVESTVTAPLPAFAASPAVSAEIVDRLAVCFRAAQDQPWFRSLAEPIMIVGFAASSLDDFNVIRARDLEANRAGYPLPA